MRIAVISHSAVVPGYRDKFHYLAKLGCEVHLILPPRWPEGGKNILAPPTGKERGICLHQLPARYVGRVGGFHLLGLGAIIRRLQPDIIHAEEEPYSIVTWQALQAARKTHAPFLFFTWENILRTYKWPLRWIDARVLQHASCAIAGSQEAASVLLKRGFTGQCAVIPQYGVDPDRYQPVKVPQKDKRVFTLGFFGRLCEEKGLMTLLRAVAELNFSWRLLITGNGGLRSELERKVKAGHMEKNVDIIPAIDNQNMPQALKHLDALVLPSETRPDWKEQFGRVLIEAMSSGIPVIGSDSGEIPNVIGNAGLIFPERDWKSLVKHLTDLHVDSRRATALGRRGRERVLKFFTTERIARKTLVVYNQMLERTNVCPH